MTRRWLRAFYESLLGYTSCLLTRAPAFKALRHIAIALRLTAAKSKPLPVCVARFPSFSVANIQQNVEHYDLQLPALGGCTQRLIPHVSPTI